MKILLRKILNNIALLAFFVVFFSTYFFSLTSSYASDCDDPNRCGVGRIRSCTASGNPQGLYFDPTQNGADIMFDLSNPVCLTVIATSYAAVKTAIAAMCYACGLKKYPDPTPSPVRDTALIIAGGVKASSSSSGPCGTAVATASAAMATALAEIAVIYGTAKLVFDNTTVCGAKWLDADPDKYNISKSSAKGEMEQWVKDNPTADLSSQNYRQWYYDGVEYEDHPDKGDYCEDPTGSNVKSSGHFPRQKYYLRGTRAGNFNCSQYDLSLSNSSINPNATADDYKKAYDCCRSRSQEHICIDYKTSDAPSGPLSNNDGVFCKSGNNCTIKGITFSAAPITSSDSRLICAQSYSLCPYNFTIGKGGTTICDYYQDGVKSGGKYEYITPDDISQATDPINPTNDCNRKSEIRNSDCTYNSKAGQCKNYCQYLTHCTVVGNSNYKYQSNLNSPYFSSACLNFVGDSRNMTTFNSGIIFGSQRHFSAPIAQCVKETLENIFYNKAGHTRCLDANEYPLADGTCVTGNYVHSGFFTYKKGNQVKEVSFFSGLQDKLQTTIKFALTLAIMFYGIKILIAHNSSEIKKSDLIMFCIKIGLVMYFATGDAWQTYFFEGVYNSSTVFSKMVFDIESTLPQSKQDGCQFDSASLGQERAYPAGKDYLSIWDTLDCKIARYLGFSPEASAANIASLIFAGLFTGPYGIYFVIGLMFFGFFFLAMTLRALHIFLSSAASIILMVYISPIIIPMALIPKTANLFKEWLTNLISFCLQPMILFAYIATFIIVFDSTMIGSATFSGNPPNKTISCKSTCQDTNGNPVNGDIDCSMSGHQMVGGVCRNTAGYTVTDDPTCSMPGNSLSGAVCRDASGNDVGGDPDCSKPGHNMISPLNDSIACLVSIDDYGKINFLETIGISIPAIHSLFTDHVKEKILTIIKAAFVMYVLCQFIDQISEITSQLIGGAALPGSKNSATGLMTSAAGIAEGIRGRITRGGIKFGKESYKDIKDSVRRGAGTEKEAADSKPASKGDGANEAGTSQGPQDDNAAGQATENGDNSA